MQYWFIWSSEMTLNWFSIVVNSLTSSYISFSILTRSQIRIRRRTRLLVKEYLFRKQTILTMPLTLDFLNSESCHCSSSCFSTFEATLLPFAFYLVWSSYREAARSIFSCRL